MGALLDRITAGIARPATAARRRFAVVDHVWSASDCYSELSAGQAAAAAAYYGFFAVLGMGVIGFVVLGQVFQNNSRVIEAITTYLRDNLPQIGAKELIDSSRQIGVFALVGLVFAGVAWVHALRSSLRALWQLDRGPGNAVVRWLIDLGVLAGLGLLLLVSVAISAGLQDLFLWLAGEAVRPAIRVILHGSDLILASLIDLILGAALLGGVPRLRLPWRRLLPAALLFTVGFGLLKTLGKLYITRTAHNPAYQVAAGTVGLLIFMYLLHQILLFTAALAATSRRGRVVDLAYGRPYREVPPVGRRSRG